MLNGSDVVTSSVGRAKTSMAMLNFKISADITRGEWRNVQHPKPAEGIWKTWDEAEPTEREMDMVVWVLDEPFEFGVLPMQPTNKISLSFLKKVSAYVKTKNMYPVLNLQSWLHISKLKLQMGDHMPWIYLRLFDILKQHTKEGYGSNGNNWDFRCEQLRKGREDKRDEFRVPTFEFLVFLYIQNSYKIMKRMSAQITLQAQKQDNRRAVKSSELKIQNENLHYQFVFDNIEELIDCLQEGYNCKDKISLTIVEALNLLFCCTTSPKECVTERLEIVVTKPKISELVHFNSETLTVDRVKFVTWIRSSLTLNPWSSASSFVHCPKVYPPTGSTKKDSTDEEQNRIIYSQRQPSCSLRNFRWAVLSNVCHQVYYHDQKLNAAFCNLKVHRCNNSYVYAPGVYNCIFIDKCVNSTIFLGATAKVVKFFACTNIKVYSVARLAIITDCIKSSFFLLTPSPPILTGTKNDSIHLGPYNTFYPNLADDMERVDLQATVSNWNSPIQIAFDGFSAVSPSPVLNFIGPGDFTTFCFPFEIVGTTTANPLLLPDDYQLALDLQASKSKQWEEILKRACLPEGSMDEYKKAIAIAFKEWLLTTGFGKELDGLLNLKRKVKQLDHNLFGLEKKHCLPEFPFSDPGSKEMVGCQDFLAMLSDSACL